MTAHLKRRGRIWYLVDGHHRKSLHTSRKGYAQQLLLEHIQKNLGVYKTPHRPVSEFIPGYLTHCETFNKSNTVADKRYTLGLFVQLMGDPDLHRITRNTVEEYLGKRRTQGRSNERWNKETDYLGHFFKYLMRERVLHQNPCAGAVRQKVVRNKRPKDLSDEQIGQLLAYLENNNPQLGRMAVLVGNTGLRVREVANLEWADVDLKRGMLHVTAKPDWKPKDYEERSIGINGAARAELEAQKRESIGLPLVFHRQDGQRYGRGLDVAMLRAFRKAGIPSGGFHSLRHTFATRAILGGVDQETLRKMMGHSDARTLLKYLHVRDEHVKASVEKVRFGG